MNHPGIRYIANEKDKEYTSEGFYGNKHKQTYISSSRELKNSGSRQPISFKTSPARMGKPDNQRYCNQQPPRATPFQRSRASSQDKKDKSRSECRSITKDGDQNRREVLKFSKLSKKLEEQMRERQKYQEMYACQQLKVANLTDEINKLRDDKRQLQRTLLGCHKQIDQKKHVIEKANINIEQLSRNLRQAKMNQKSLTNLKNLQNQIQYLQQRNKKLLNENQQLTKVNKNLKNDLDKVTRQNSSQSDNSKMQKQHPKVKQKQLTLDNNKHKSQRQRFLEGNLHNLQKKLYQKDNLIKKMQIQLNCIDRKKVLSIDEVKFKKDMEIKDLRQKVMKVTKDLRQTKDKFKQKNLKSTGFLRKVKSSKNLGHTSESEEVTLQLSSEA